jgi:hypothetical protein
LKKSDNTPDDASNSEGSIGTQAKGWTADGIRRFNELYKLVKDDRQARDEVVVEWIQEMKLIAKPPNKCCKNTENIPIALMDDAFEVDMDKKPEAINQTTTIGVEEDDKDDEDNNGSDSDNEEIYS